MTPFEYHAPVDLQNALILLRDNGQPLAGGTDLFLRMERAQLEPTILVDLKRIPGLNRLEQTGNEIHIGALTCMQDIASAPMITKHGATLAASAKVVGSTQTRNRATIGGNVANASPAADATPSLMALGALAHIANVEGTRELAVEELFVGPGQTVLQHGEIVTQFSFLRPPPHSGSSFQRCTRTAMDIALVNCAVSLTLDQGDRNQITSARMVLGAVGPTAVRAVAAERLMVGQPCTDKLAEAVAECATTEASPIDDVRASAAYRSEMVRVLTRRAIDAALQAAQGKA